MSNSVYLSSSVRQNLQQLQTTEKLLEQATQRLSTGLKVSSPLDDPVAYFKAKGYTDRADALTGRLDDMNESVETINAADNGITNVQKFLSQMGGIIDDARATTDSDQRRELGKQFNDMIAQINGVAKDSSYGGINLLQGNDSKTVQFSKTMAVPRSSWMA